jgi:hypothetical protein
MSNQDIRDWAAARGIKISDRGRIAQSTIDQYNAATNGDGALLDDEDELALDLDDLDDLDLDDPDPGGPESDPEPPAEPPLSGVVRERPPVPQPKPRRRLRGITRKPRPAKPKSKTGAKRVSLESVVGSAYSGAALILGNMARGQFIPVARCLEMQSRTAGTVAEDMLKGTAADRFLQPFARLAEKGGQAGALLGLPVLVGIVTAQPALFPAAQPILRIMVMNWLELSGPALDKQRARAEKIGLNAEEVDGIIAGLWAGVPVAAQPSADEEAAVRRARGD